MLTTVRKLRFKAILLGFKQHEFIRTSLKNINIIILLQLAPHDFWIKKPQQTNQPTPKKTFISSWSMVMCYKKKPQTSNPRLSKVLNEYNNVYNQCSGIPFAPNHISIL